MFVCVFAHRLVVCSHGLSVCSHGLSVFSHSVSVCVCVGLCVCSPGLSVSSHGLSEGPYTCFARPRLSDLPRDQAVKCSLDREPHPLPLRRVTCACSRSFFCFFFEVQNQGFKTRRPCLGMRDPTYSHRQLRCVAFQGLCRRKNCAICSTHVRCVCRLNMFQPIQWRGAFARFGLW